ncbi:MAG: hypothetical protein O7F16_08490, partial [Acidobacteria bacterium]|nr:hypothetical protein [Acidobacteriota bacterium]
VVTEETDTSRPPDGDLSNDRIIVSDPRADDLLNRETKVEEKQRFEFSAGYGLTSWLSLQFEVGYYQADISPVDVQLSVDRWAAGANQTPNQFQLTTEISSVPITAGELTQIPVSINALIHFRKDSPFNPFLGIGMGYMFNDLDVGTSFDNLNNEILRGFNRVMSVPTSESSDTLINVQEISRGFVSRENQNISKGVGPEFLREVDCTNISGDQANILDACTAIDSLDRFAVMPTEPFLKAEVEDSFFWQFSLGADYHFNERVSAYVVARYQVTDAKVNVTCTGIASEIENGELVTRGRFEEDQCTFRYIGEQNPNQLAPDVFRENRFIRTEIDPQNLNLETQRLLTLYEQVLFQGGEIDLTSFVVGAGIRFTF